MPVDQFEQVALGPDQPVQVYGHNVCERPGICGGEHLPPARFNASGFGRGRRVILKLSHHRPATNGSQLAGASQLPVDTLLFVEGLAHVDCGSDAHA